MFSFSPTVGCMLNLPAVLHHFLSETFSSFFTFLQKTLALIVFGAIFREAVQESGG